MEKNKFDSIFQKILTETPNSSVFDSIVVKVVKSCGEFTWRGIGDILTYIKTNNIQKLKEKCYSGLPDDLPCLRALIWKINLHFLPSNISQWDTFLLKKRNEYKEIKKGFAIRRKLELDEFKEFDSCNSEEDKKEKFSAMKTNRILLESIEKDVNRTHPFFDFFSKPVTKNSTLSSNEINEILVNRGNLKYQYTKKRDLLTLSSEEQTHYDVLARLLYIYAKMNDDVKYVQGMNEILAPIYYCYSIGSSFDENEDDIEADSYWSFQLLMKEIKCTFQKEKDYKKDGIFSKVKILENILKKFNLDIFEHFKKNCVDLNVIGFRWFNILFTHDFFMPEILRIWDIILSEEDKFYFVYIFSLGIIENNKTSILKCDFYGIINKLQCFEYNSIEEIISKSIKIHLDKEKKIKSLIKQNKEKC